MPEKLGNYKKRPFWERDVMKYLRQEIWRTSVRTSWSREAAVTELSGLDTQSRVKLFYGACVYGEVLLHGNQALGLENLLVGKEEMKSDHIAPNKKKR
jgi:hypothetical protein